MIQLAAGALLASSLARPARALDVLEGLEPADFQAGVLATAELRALESTARLDPADWIPVAREAAPSPGGTTLTELGIPSVAAEVLRSDDSLGSALGQPAPADLRVLASPDLRGSLAEVLGAGGDLGSLSDLLGEVGEGDLGGALDEVLGGDLLEDLPLEDLPVDELLDVIDGLGDGVLGGLPGGLLGRSSPPQ